jgi:FAD/FMN-containing dehydrogenases
VRRAAEARVAIVPWSGGTGLVGGQVMEDGPPPIVLSLERMDAIRSVSPEEEAIVVEAGAILADVQAAAAAADRLFPLSLASEGSARIGGLLSTNAGGVAVLLYGNARDLTLGIEAVLPDGSILSGPKTLRKDNTGYDLRHLLIGAEGTIGVVTVAELRLFPRPRETVSAFCAVLSPQATGALLRRVRDRLGYVVTAFELMC